MKKTITTEKQVALLKSQTFGVEVEMNNITRENAAKVAATYFGTFNYRDTASNDGYYTYSAFDAQGRKWKFSRDCSIAGPFSEQCEMVTPVLKYEDMELLQGLIRELRRAGAKSNPQRGCGVHIHVGGDGHTARTIRNLVNDMNRRQEYLQKSIGIARDRLDTYCKPVNRQFFERLNAEKPRTIQKLEDIWYESQGSSWDRRSHYNGTRYHMLNLHAFFNRYHTVEFRLFQFDNPTESRQGGLHAGQLKAMIQLCLAMNAYAKTVNSVSTDKIRITNEKEAFRKWFVSLGLVGDEFATCREYLLRNVAENGRGAH